MSDSKNHEKKNHQDLMTEDPDYRRKHEDKKLDKNSENGQQKKDKDVSYNPDRQSEKQTHNSGERKRPEEQGKNL